MDCSMQASLTFTISWSSLKLMSIELVMPFKHLILWHLLLLHSIFTSIRVFSNQSALCIRWPRCIYVEGTQVSASKSGCLCRNSFSSSAGGRDLPCWQLTPSGPMDSNLPASHLSNWSLSHLRKQGSILVWSRTKKLVSLSPPFLWPMSNQSASPLSSTFKTFLLYLATCHLRDWHLGSGHPYPLPRFLQQLHNQFSFSSFASLNSALSVATRVIF